MRVFTVIQALALAAGTALATGAEISAQLTNVNTKTLALQSTVQSWRGDLFGSIPILTKSAALLLAIHEGKETADDSDPLTGAEAIGIAGSVSTLATTVNSTMTTLIAAHGKFKHLLLAPIVLLDLKAQKKASDDMSNAILAKVPAELKGIATNLVAPIDASFDVAIDAFSLSNGV